MTNIENVSPEYLVESVRELADDGWRLVQIHCLLCGVGVHEGYDLTYSFDKDYALRHLRVLLPEKYTHDSISAFYPYAFLYENEMHDLFGISFRNMNIDYGGTLYRTEISAPMRERGGEGNGR